MLPYRFFYFLFFLCPMMSPICIAKDAVTVKGNVLSTEEDHEGTKEPGIKLKLSTESGDLLIHVGPKSFLSRNSFNLTNGEPITVVGFRFSIDKPNELLASEIRKKSGTITLRTPAGEPAWKKQDHLK